MCSKKSYLYSLIYEEKIGYTYQLFNLMNYNDIISWRLNIYMHIILFTLTTKPLFCNKQKEAQGNQKMNYIQLTSDLIREVLLAILLYK